MQNRVKEISIRKVMGASENSLLVLLSKDYVVLIVYFTFAFCSDNLLSDEWLAAII